MGARPMVSFIRMDSTWSYFMKDFGFHRGNYPSPLFGLRTELELGAGKNFVFPEKCFEWLAQKQPPRSLQQRPPPSDARTSTTTATTSTSASAISRKVGDETARNYDQDGLHSHSHSETKGGGAGVAEDGASQRVKETEEEGVAVREWRLKKFRKCFSVKKIRK